LNNRKLYKGGYIYQIKRVFKIKIIVTIPAYKEEESIGNIIREIKEKYNYDVLVVDDGSPDNTSEVAELAGAIVVKHYRNLGLAKTFKTEMEHCLKLNADIIIHLDGDNQYNIDDLHKLVSKVKQGYDLVIGSRFLEDNYSGSFSKKIGNKLFAKLFTRLLKTKITDTTTGFRAFTPEVAKIQLNTKFSYTHEQLIKASERFKICEVSIRTNKTRNSRLFKNPIDYAIKAGVNLFRIYRDYNPLKFFSILSLLFIIPGLAIGSILSYWFIIDGTIHNRVPLAIVCIFLLLLGFQILIFGFIADMKNG